MIDWSMTTFKTLDLGNSNAWRMYMIDWSMTTFQTLDLGEFQCLEGGT